MRPLLALHENGEEHKIGSTRDAVATVFDLSEEDRAERLPSGRVTTLQNRVGWAAMYLFRAELLERPRRAHYRITQRGREMLEANPERIDLGVLSQFEEFREFRQSNGSSGDVAQPKSATSTVSESATAEERMSAGEEELRTALAADVLDRVKEGTWERFEQQVLDVLKAMGYGGPRGSVERLGGHGSDHGVDGVIREDKLGLEEIYVQAKFWSDKGVGRPEVQGFIGALHGKGASKGIFITTSKFSPDAKAYADEIQSRVILIDGRELANLMIEYEVGVTVRETFEIKDVDLEYFAPDEGAVGS